MACYQDALEKIVLGVTGLEARQNKIWESGTYTNRYVGRHAPCGSGHISENVRLQDVVANSHISDFQAPKKQYARFEAKIPPRKRFLGLGLADATSRRSNAKPDIEVLIVKTQPVRCTPSSHSRGCRKYRLRNKITNFPVHANARSVSPTKTVTP
jgi:hypothetical protein